MMVGRKSFFCAACMEEMKEDVEKVREYLRTHKRPTIMDVHYMTGIPVQTIQQFIKEGIINRGS
ncbi:hypothetical protein [Paenibacillus soyae]|uniref:Uncharacterized protein n=1 Tax=Paenibacillus soyae TaxID=2969249 RepID=A0A9X2MPI9_9BACL|nr:hypothetical protein [Paenibacillus soyae]MCR2805843.1 hypothetical protein [Paenibacillus soyae]